VSGSNHRGENPKPKQFTERKNTMYVYLIYPNAGANNNDLYTVGFYAPSGKFIPESDCATRILAATRVNYLNGGFAATFCDQITDAISLSHEK
jgi:hypothetical protein